MLYNLLKLLLASFYAYWGYTFYKESSLESYDGNYDSWEGTFNAMTFFEGSRY